jgi:hypothetical protein
VNPGLVGHFGERSDPTDAAQAMHSVIDYGDTRGIVAAVLELAQALEQDGNDITLSDCTNDSAHVLESANRMLIGVYLLHGAPIPAF